MDTIYTLPQLGESTIEYRLSFRPFIAFLKAQQRTYQTTSGLFELYNYLIDQFSTAQDQEDGHGQPVDALELKKLFQLATVVVLPLDPTKRTIPYAFGTSVPLKMFHVSDAFEQLVTQTANFLVDLPNQISVQQRQRFIYQLILEKCYGIRTSEAAAPSFHFQHKQKGLVKYYRLDINASFTEPRLDGSLPPLESAWIDFARDATPLPDDVEPLPVDAFLFEGFSFFQLEDITEAETIQQLQDVFAHLHSDTEPIIYHRFESALRNLCGQPNLQIGIVPLPQVNGKFVAHPASKTRSIFLRHAEADPDFFTDDRAQQMITHLFGNPSPHIFPDLQGLSPEKQQMLNDQGYRSFLMYPISSGGEVLGILEMGSPRADTFNENVLAKIEQIIPLIQELLRYQLNQFQSNLEQLIRKKFTSLQPSVEWKFYETAWQYLRRGQSESAGSDTIPVRFQQVYPLYGAVDIRNSSVERHKATQLDLANQLTAVENLFADPNFPSSSERPEQLRVASFQCQHKLLAGPLPEEEQEITLFLEREINSYFRILEANHPLLQSTIQAYFRRVDPDTGLFNQAVKRYERSMDWLNVTVNEYIDNEEKKLQRIHPHYFERYRTDGTEYTMYVGQSIAPHLSFEPALVQQLCQWQLTSMVQMAQLTHQLLPSLPLPLQTTQLILAHNHPVDISFRHDERRLDVEGSYSIRYEVLKKRIDKAVVDGRQERLTQPDTIALVYSHTSELAVYLPYIAQLQADGQLADRLDYLNLEPMQGIVHLKALRLHILYPEPAHA
ncbi:GAF domain-containing protein [Spirosoma utsteinense]|uniref:GAF domain-containing protein n=1 Tax=Spirosoma utsteinense TaxID=2585773 RepID=A0ABR6W6P3_9BACT|nr:GAF domain-containing protein [Spirosoma utsteinense]MBC3787561.1 hypothetical protein [Spirosoma utsteinense]MBC3792248.1 hypothetical protein [Spirosoma utsteinense]